MSRVAVLTGEVRAVAVSTSIATTTLLEPTTGPQGMVLWYLRPGLVVVMLGGVTCYALRGDHGVGSVTATLAICLVVAWGLATVRRLTHLHRAFGAT
ncbi:hypothetical protein [Intrasporangium calvum]|uniref:hypothetical protein n=1 Tax=Intrasporangium calvum TaxID=53358 RepID=UPI000DF635F9|nr:hypothetical protein [Intrasporangium calvum]AXG12246.1 hypothetical protein DN585_01265 [Intrasporangium calvum]